MSQAKRRSTEVIINGKTAPTGTPIARYEKITIEITFQPSKKLPEFITRFAITAPDGSSAYDITVPSQNRNDRVLTVNVEFAPGYFQTGRHIIFAGIGREDHGTLVELACGSCLFSVIDSPPAKITLADFSNPVTLRINPKTPPD